MKDATKPGEPSPLANPSELAARGEAGPDRRPRVGVYGGSFNPPHIGHVLMVVWALSIGAVDEVCVIPCFQHPFAKELESFEDRLAMTERALAFLPGVHVSRVEAELGGESRTLRTLTYLQEQHPTWQMRLLLGADILADTHKWHGFEEVVALAPLLVAARLGFPSPDVPPPALPDVSSTEVRAALAGGRTHELTRVVPHGVLELIRARGLYR